MRALYIKQGKWVQFLAKRMPEYAEYQSDVVSELALELQKAGRQFLEDQEANTEAEPRKMEQLGERTPAPLEEADNDARETPTPEEPSENSKTPASAT